ncbi:MAG TPA: galactose oxidase-like domain-containing protein [Myxococcales bacterium]|nr:galactose oxidase-like domain-containing protein [Myxococcales bacterium]
MRVSFAASLGSFLLAAAAAAQSDPSVAGQWSPLANWGMTATHAHMLPEGKVMWWPEFTDGDNPTLWDPATGTNSPLPHANYNMFCSGHTFTPDGRLFVAGGHIVDDTGLSIASIFDPATSTWTRLPDMNAGRWYPSTIALPSGDFLVTGGTMTPSTGENLIPQVWESANNRWRSLTSASLSLPTYSWTFATPAGNVFVAGPKQQSRFLSTAGTGSFSNGPLSHFAQDRIYGSAVMYEPGKVLIAGGAPLTTVPTDTMETIDLTAAAPAFSNVGPLKRPRRQLNMTLLPDGTVLVTGGHSGVGRDNPSAAVLETELWNPATGTTTLLAPAGAYRGYHSVAVLLPDGRVLSAGSTGTFTAQVFSPPYLFKGTRPSMSSAPASISYGQAFDVATADAARISQVTLVRLTSVTHSFNMNQRFNRLTFTATATGLSVKAPDRPELAPPGHYFLFVLDGAGIPSVGRVVRLGGTAASPPPPPAGIPLGSVWKYDDRNVDPGPSWTTLGFDDSTWKSGPAQLGYGDGDETTVLTHMSPAQPSYYFRKKISLAAPANASFKLIHDDGIAVYVNGALVFTKYMAAGLQHAAYASATSADNEVSTFSLSSTAFLAGDNEVAVLVKQASGTSSDVSFDLQLTFDASVTPPPAPAHLTVVAPNGGETLTSGSAFDVRWTTAGTVTSVRLELSQDGGTTWGLIAETANAGHFSWTVPAVDTTRALMRISDPGAPAVTDQSDATFTIHAPVANPPGVLVAFGEVWKYDDRNVDPGTSWTTLAFNDSTWKSGPAQLGYGDGDEATVLTHMSPAQPSYYFRKKITLAQPTGAVVKVIHDDGVAIWLNGSLVFSKYTANGLAHAAYASTTSADNELSSFTLPSSAFLAGDNQLAVMVKQASGTSSDVSFDLEVTASATGPAPVVVIKNGDVWKYDDRNVDPGPSWTAATFDDSAWKSGPGQLGYGDGDEATVLAHPVPAQPTVYFRRKITLAKAVTAANAVVLHDDGVLVFVNGHQVFSKYVGSTAHTAFATATSDENEVSTFAIDPALLVAGENTFAIAIKQASPTSSDISFDFQLTVTPAP